MRSDMDHTVLPANYTMPAFTPQPQSITTLWLVLIYRPTEGRRLSRPGWLLHTEMKCLRWESNPDTVTHPSTNRARRRVTSLIQPTPLPLRHAATPVVKTILMRIFAVRVHSSLSEQVSAAADRPARRGASCWPCYTQMWTVSVINWRPTTVTSL